MVKRTRRNIGVVMEKLSKRALGCMYTAAIIGVILEIIALVAVNMLWFIPEVSQRNSSIFMKATSLWKEILFH